MLNTIIYDQTENSSSYLLNNIRKYCPTLRLQAVSKESENCSSFLTINSFEIIFIDPSGIPKDDFSILYHVADYKAVICMTDNYNFIHLKPLWKSVAFLLKPINANELIIAVDSAKEYLRKIKDQQIKNALGSTQLNQTKEDRLIGIPTIEGYEVIKIDDIIHCEGLQKCTRIVTRDKSDIVSSYNIGVYKKKLLAFSGFFSPHRSHIINIFNVVKFKKSGTIILNNGSNVPISKNKKEEFLSFINRV